jgi:nucleoside-diphosphate-sugar epimerase
VGCWTARALRALDLPVRAINRSGKRPPLMPADVEIVATDASDEAQAQTVGADAAVVYQAPNPAYHSWHELFPGLQKGALAAAMAANARYISIDNLYLYDASAPIHEESPVAPVSKKGELRARMAEEVLAAHSRGNVQAAILHASDYFGPGVTGSALG